MNQAGLKGAERGGVPAGEVCQDQALAAHQAAGVHIQLNRDGE